MFLCENIAKLLTRLLALLFITCPAAADSAFTDITFSFHQFFFRGTDFFSSFETDVIKPIFLY
jgi:hypothetical protein